MTETHFKIIFTVTVKIFSSPFKPPFPVFPLQVTKLKEIGNIITLSVAATLRNDKQIHHQKPASYRSLSLRWCSPYPLPVSYSFFPVPFSTGFSVTDENNIVGRTSETPCLSGFLKLVTIISQSPGTPNTNPLPLISFLRFPILMFFDT